MNAPQHRSADSWPTSLSQWKKLALRSWREAGDDNIALIAAGVAFYGFVALVPLLGAIVLTYGLLANPETVIHDMKRLTAVMPPGAAHLVREQMMQLVRSSSGKKGLGVLGALAVALFGTRNGTGSVITALNVAYEVKEKRGFLALNGLALIIAACAVVASIMVLTAIALLGQIQHLIPGLPDTPVIFGKIVSYILLVLVGAAAAATLYRYGPSRDDARWVWMTPGTLFAALCWLLLTVGFGTYAAELGHYDATYGSLSAVIGMLTWLYLSSYVLLYGAELNSGLARGAAEGTVSAPGERQAPAAATASPAMGETVTFPDELVETLPFSLATIGLAMIHRRGTAGRGAALIVVAMVSMWLRREKGRRYR